MSRQITVRQHRVSYVHYYRLRTVHHDRGEVVGVLSVPGHTQEGCLLWTFEQDRRVLQVPDIKVSDGAVGAGAGEGVNALGECDVEHFLVVGDQLCFDCLLLNVPDSAGCVDAAGADGCGIAHIPVKGCQRRREVRLLGLPILLSSLLYVQFGLQYCRAMSRRHIQLPQSQVLSRRRQQIRLRAILGGRDNWYFVWHPHQFSRRVLVLEHQLLRKGLRLLR